MFIVISQLKVTYCT